MNLYPPGSRHRKGVKYNDKLDADEQITAEEGISAFLFDHFPGIDEEDANDAGKQILRMVLEKFRPDLFA